MSTRVDSITNFQHTEAEADDLLVQDLVENAMDLSDEELARIRAIALSEPILVNRLVPPDANITARSAPSMAASLRSHSCCVGLPYRAYSCPLIILPLPFSLMKSTTCWVESK